MAQKVTLDDTWYYITFDDLNVEYKCKSSYMFEEAIVELLTVKQYEQFTGSEMKRVFTVSDKRAISVSEDLEMKKLLKLSR